MKHVLNTFFVLLALVTAAPAAITIQLRNLEQAGATNGQAMVWDNALGKWKPGTVVGGSGAAIGFGTGAPSGGVDGDVYFLTVSPFTEYKKVSGSWVAQFSFGTAAAKDVGTGSTNVAAGDAPAAAQAAAIAAAATDATTKANAALAASLFANRTAKTGAYTVVLGDKGVCFDSTSGTFTYTLTTAATLGSGFSCAFINSGSGTVTIDPNGSETIRDAAGSSTTRTLIQGEAGILVCDGTGFFLIKTSAPGSGTDANAIHGNASAEINALTSKGTPVGADIFMIEDSAASNGKKKVTLDSLPVPAAATTQLSSKANLTGGNTITGIQLLDKIAFAAQNGSTITGGGTLTLSNGYQVNYATFSGSTATIALPSGSGTWTATVHGYSTYNSGTQTITVPSLIRPEYNTSTPITTFVIPQSAGTYWTAQFTCIAGTFTKFSVVGDTLAPSGTDSLAFHTTTAGEINGLTSKATPTTSDQMVIEDAAASNAKKKMTLNAMPVSSAQTAAIAAAVAGRNVTFVLTIDALADSMNYTLAYVPAAFTITELRFVHNGTLSSPSIVPTVKHGTDRSSGTAVVTSPSAVTSSTTGASVTTFNSATTAANAWLWLETASKSGTTDKFTVVVVGHY